jgi:hypothetical protein
MNILLSPYWLLGVSGWYLISGVLHDFFVIKNHKGPYNRDLLRLLMDGHVLILSGLILFICFSMVSNKIPYGALISSILAIGMLVYCGMIYPFLKSYFTMFLSLMVIIVSIRAWLVIQNTTHLSETKARVQIIK